MLLLGITYDCRRFVAQKILVFYQSGYLLLSNITLVQ